MGKCKKSKGKNLNSEHSKNKKESSKRAKDSGDKKHEKRAKKRNQIDKHDDASFRHQLEGSNHRRIHEMAEDGNCLFRSLSDQLYGDYGQKHVLIRSQICEYLEENEDNFKGFVVLDEDEENSDEHASSYEEYIDRMKQEGEWGGNPELVAAAQLYKRNITVYSAGGAFSIDCGHEKSLGLDLMVSYHENSHYNSVEDFTRKLSNEKLKSTSDSSISKSNPKDDDCKENSKKKTQKRNEKCSCGSGVKYKDCCLAQQKRAQKLQKWKEKNGTVDSDEGEQQKVDSSNGDTVALENDFKILQI